jgi:hypothetical protein
MKELKTHFGLGPEAVQEINYDYDGPGGCQRKFVKTPDTVFVYHQIGNEWAIVYNLAR